MWPKATEDLEGLRLASRLAQLAVFPRDPTIQARVRRQVFAILLQGLQRFSSWQPDTFKAH